MRICCIVKLVKELRSNSVNLSQFRLVDYLINYVGVVIGWAVLRKNRDKIKRIVIKKTKSVFRFQLDQTLLISKPGQ